MKLITVTKKQVSAYIDRMLKDGYTKERFNEELDLAISESIKWKDSFNQRKFYQRVKKQLNLNK